MNENEVWEVSSVLFAWAMARRCRYASWSEYLAALDGHLTKALGTPSGKGAK